MSPLNGERPDLELLFQRQHAIHRALKHSQVDAFLADQNYFSHLPQVKVTAETGPNHIRTQDAFHLDWPRQLFIIADGVGGAEAGDVASRIAVATFAEYFQKIVDQDQPYSEQGLAATFQAAADETRVRLQVIAVDHDVKQLGTTLTLVHLFKVGTQTWLFEATIGDSSAYLVESNTCTKLSRNHLLWAQLAQLKPDGSFNDQQLNFIAERLFSPEEKKLLGQLSDSGRLADVVSQVVAALDKCSDRRHLEELLRPLLSEDTPEVKVIHKFLVMALPEKSRFRGFGLEGYATVLFHTRHAVQALFNDHSPISFSHTLTPLSAGTKIKLALLTDGATDPLRASQTGIGLVQGKDIAELVHQANADETNSRRKVDDLTVAEVEIEL